MKHYFYHGFEPYGDFSDAVNQMLEIINSGEIKKRNEVNVGNSNSNHVCLYRKNERFNYNSENAILHTARAG